MAPKPNLDEESPLISKRKTSEEAIAPPPAKRLATEQQLPSFGAFFAAEAGEQAGPGPKLPDDGWQDDWQNSDFRTFFGPNPDGQQAQEIEEKEAEAGRREWEYSLHYHATRPQGKGLSFLQWYDHLLHGGKKNSPYAKLVDKTPIFLNQPSKLRQQLARAVAKKPDITADSFGMIAGAFSTLAFSNRIKQRRGMRLDEYVKVRNSGRASGWNLDTMLAYHRGNTAAKFSNQFNTVVKKYPNKFCQYNY